MGLKQRLGWIQFCLQSLGRFGVREKKAMTWAFDVSDATLSRDQIRFLQLVSDDVDVRLEKGKLKFFGSENLDVGSDVQMPNLNDWLHVMIQDDFVSVPSVSKARPTEHAIGCIVRAIHDRVPLFVLYVSRQSENPTWRAVSPHAIVEIAGRYHARCFDHLKGRYGDFVLSRMIGFNFDREDMPAYIDKGLDEDWNKKVKLQIALADPHASLSAMLDHGMENSNERIVEIRKALAPYFISRREAGFEDLVEIQALQES